MKRLKILVFSLLLGLVVGFEVEAAEPPERGLSAAFHYPGLILSLGEKVEMTLVIRNQGRQDDSFKVTVTEAPEGWSTELRSFAAGVTGLFLPGRDNGTLILSAFPPEDRPVPPGDYQFKVRVESLDGHLSQETACQVTLRAGRQTRSALGLSCPHPELKGPSDGRFSFSLEVSNQGGHEGLVNLSASAPDDWEVYFKPGYEDKQISSIQLPKDQSRSLNLEVRPDFRAGPGVYPLTVRAEAPWGRAETTLSVELTGTYQIRLIPANELLSAATEPGRPVSLGFFLINEGSAPQREVRLLTVAPDNWKVELDPPVITDLAAGRSPILLTLTVTPSDQALVGDYGLALVAEGERSKSPLDLRLTVRAKPVWAWLGLGIIGLTVLGLALTFRRLSRR